MIYALYRGDEFVDVAKSYQELARRHNVRVETMKFRATPTYHKKAGEGTLLVYRYEEEADGE